MTELEFRQVITVDDLLRVAVSLCDDPIDPDTSEYVRGIVEVIADSCVKSVDGRSYFLDESKNFATEQLRQRSTLKLRCKDCDLTGHRDADHVYHGDRDVEPCPGSTDDFHHWVVQPVSEDDQRFYRTVFAVEVFSDGRYEVHDDDRMSDLHAIDYDITEGDNIGNVEQISQEPIPRDQVERHLLRIGNDGTFFEPVSGE